MYADFGKNMLQYCTLFNSLYLTRGLAMYNSLLKHCRDFHLYIVAFDDDCFYALSKLRLEHATVIPLSDFENENLLAVKADRTAGEYCWTCASSSVKYCIETYGLDHCTYVDADLLFFSDPKVLYDEMAEKSVLITSHRYTPQFDQSTTSGIYCVQYVTFKNTAEGMAVLNNWVDACLEWCFNRFEDNKFGDQKYLDAWTQQFSGIHELEHLGGGVAPWNVQQYAFDHASGRIQGLELASNNRFDLVFYHYHGFAYALNNNFMLTNDTYPLNRNQIKHIYKPYVLALSAAESQIELLEENIQAYKATNDGTWVKQVIGRSVLFFLRGFYKQFYSKRAIEYGFPN
ncbi:hypothetical protein ABIE26_004665 [Pedobacter africanus]